MKHCLRGVLGCHTEMCARCYIAASVLLKYFLTSLTMWLYFSPFPDGLAAFRTFLKTEFSDENIEFWMACEEYKKVKSSTKLVSKANKIYKEFIDTQAPREVCLCVLIPFTNYSRRIYFAPKYTEAPLLLLLHYFSWLQHKYEKKVKFYAAWLKVLRCENILNRKQSDDNL